MNPHAPRPLGGYSIDPVQQAAAVRSMRRRERRLVGSFAGIAVVFTLSLVAGLSGFPAFAVVGMALFIPLATLGMIYTFPPKPPVCTSCGKTMEIEWRPVGQGRDGRFAVCECCKRYVDTLWTSR